MLQWWVHSLLSENLQRPELQLRLPHFFHWIRPLQRIHSLCRGTLANCWHWAEETTEPQVKQIFKEVTSFKHVHWPQNKADKEEKLPTGGSKRRWSLCHISKTRTRNKWQWPAASVLCPRPLFSLPTYRETKHRAKRFPQLYTITLQAL